MRRDARSRKGWPARNCGGRGPRAACSRPRGVRLSARPASHAVMLAVHASRKSSQNLSKDSVCRRIRTAVVDQPDSGSPFTAGDLSEASPSTSSEAPSVRSSPTSGLGSGGNPYATMPTHWYGPVWMPCCPGGPGEGWTVRRSTWIRASSATTPPSPMACCSRGRRPACGNWPRLQRRYGPGSRGCVGRLMSMLPCLRVGPRLRRVLRTAGRLVPRPFRSRPARLGTHRAERVGRDRSPRAT